ncbi:MAG: hypothetical protein WA705_04370 [Candidatus Ozemobacteraceae bacterium]
MKDKSLTDERKPSGRGMLSAEKQTPIKNIPLFKSIVYDQFRKTSMTFTDHEWVFINVCMANQMKKS